MRRLFFLLLLPNVAFGQQLAAPDTLEVLDLDQIIEAIYISNPDLMASRLTAEAALTKRAQVSALPDPMVMFTALPLPLYTARGTQRAQIRLEQGIPFPGKLSLQGEIADLEATIYTHSTEILRENLTLQAKHTYFELYRLQRHELLLQEFQHKLSDFESVATTQYEVGLGMQQAILKAQLERNALSQRLLDIDWQRKSAAETLAKLLDRPVSISAGTSIKISRPDISRLDEAFLVSAALRHNPEMSSLNTSAEKAEVAVNLAKKLFYPDFAVNMTYFDLAGSDIPPNADGKNALSLGISVKVPLQRGRLKAHVEETKLRRAQVEASTESFVSMVRTQIADNVSRIKEYGRQLDLYQQALIPQAETTLEATLSAYTTGRTDFLNLVDAERMLFTIHTGYEDVFAKLLKSIANLERELGVLSISSIDDL